MDGWIDETARAKYLRSACGKSSATFIRALHIVARTNRPPGGSPVWYMSEPEVAPANRSIKRAPSFSLLETVTGMTSLNSPGLTAKYSPEPPKLPQAAVGASRSPPPPLSMPTQAPHASPPAVAPQRASVEKRRGSGSLQHPSHVEGDYEWLKRRLCNGEAVTCLSLSGNWAVALTPKRVGETIDYTVRDKVRVPGKDKMALVTLTDKFEYHVLGVYGEAKGRAVCFQPKTPRGMHQVYIAFRGLRNRGMTPEEDVEPAFDRAAFRDANPRHAHWLPDPSMRVHGGILDHHATTWTAGLCALFTSLVARIKRGFVVEEVLLIGLSMGGALAELTAFHAAHTHPELIPFLHVLSFGSIPWANDAVAASYDDLFGRRSVQLVLSRRDTGVRPPEATWWVAEPGEHWALLRSIFTQRKLDEANPSDAQRSYVVFDPLVARENEHFCVLPNVLACSQERGTVDARATSLVGFVQIQKRLMDGFINGTLPDGAQMMSDYNQLHYGARYRDMLVSMLRRRQDYEKEKERKAQEEKRRAPSNFISHAAAAVEGMASAISESARNSPRLLRRAISGGISGLSSPGGSPKLGPTPGQLPKWVSGKAGGVEGMSLRRSGANPPETSGRGSAVCYGAVMGSGGASGTTNTASGASSGAPQADSIDHVALNKAVEGLQQSLGGSSSAAGPAVANVTVSPVMPQRQLSGGLSNMFRSSPRALSKRREDVTAAPPPSPQPPHPKPSPLGQRRETAWPAPRTGVVDVPRTGSGSAGHASPKGGSREGSNGDSPTAARPNHQNQPSIAEESASPDGTAVAAATRAAALPPQVATGECPRNERISPGTSSPASSSPGQWRTGLLSSSSPSGSPGGSRRLTHAKPPSPKPGSPKPQASPSTSPLQMSTHRALPAEPPPSFAAFDAPNVPPPSAATKMLSPSSSGGSPGHSPKGNARVLSGGRGMRRGTARPAEVVVAENPPPLVVSVTDEPATPAGASSAEEDSTRNISPDPVRSLSPRIQRQLRRVAYGQSSSPKRPSNARPAAAALEEAAASDFASLTVDVSDTTLEAVDEQVQSVMPSAHVTTPPSPGSPIIKEPGSPSGRQSLGNMLSPSLRRLLGRADSPSLFSQQSTLPRPDDSQLPAGFLVAHSGSDDVAAAEAAVTMSAMAVSNSRRVERKSSESVKSPAARRVSAATRATALSSSLDDELSMI